MNPTASALPAASPTDRWSRLLGWGPFAIPPLYLVLIFWLQPDDHLGSAPEKAPWLQRSVYDDWDAASWILRGVNAALGRSPGRADNPEQIPADEYSQALQEDRALQDRYYLEFPPGAVLLFRLPFLFEPVPRPPAALLDGGYGNIVEHWPQDEEERQLWRQFRRLTRTYQAFMCLALLLLMLVLWAGYEPGGGLAGWPALLLLPGMLYFSLNRYDVVLALLAALGLACLGRKRILLSGVLLGAATAIKVWPVILVPLVMHFLWPRRREALGWLAVYVLTLSAIFLPPLLQFDWRAVWQPFQFQLSRSPMGPTAYGYVLPARLEASDWVGQVFRLGTVALTVLILSWRRPPDVASLLRRGAIAVIVFISVPIFYSPQWILWLSPLLIPLAQRHRPILGLLIALDLVTYVTFPLGAEGVLGGAVVYLRFGILAAIVGVLAWNEVQGSAGDRASVYV